MATVWRSKFRCTACGHSWKGKPYSSFELASEDPEPECPNCMKVLRARGIDLSLNTAPATIGANVSVKAIDETAKLVMQDYGMTDLRSDVRQGETAAPKLAPRLQAQADAFFSGGSHQGRKLPGRLGNTAMLGRAAISGGLRQPDGFNPVENLHKIGHTEPTAVRPPTKIVAAERRR